MQYVTLNNGVKMPQLGLGVLYIDDLAEMRARCVRGIGGRIPSD